MIPNACLKSAQSAWSPTGLPCKCPSNKPVGPDHALAAFLWSRFTQPAESPAKGHFGLLPFVLDELLQNASRCKKPLGA